MKKLFTQPIQFLLVLIFSLVASTNVSAQTYPIGELVEGTMRRGVPSTYFPMKNWNDPGVPWDNENASSNIPQHYRNQGQWDTSPYEEYFYASAPNSYMNIRLLPPKDFNIATEDGKKYPLIIALHGVGEAGENRSQYGGSYANDDPRIENNDHQLLFGAKEHLDARNRNESHVRHFPGFVMFPQAPAGDWTQGSSDKVIEIIEYMIDEYKVDPLRIYVWGLSGGATGAWAILDKRPDLFAAALPMSGLATVNYDYEEVAHTPIWLFQGGLDDGPTPGAAEGEIQKLKKAGGTPRYTLYPNGGHGIWYSAYTEPDFFSWMLQYSELSIHAYNNISHGGSYSGLEYCEGGTSKIKLGISPGHEDYEWSRNNVTIIGAESYNLELEDFFSPSEYLGEYKVRVILKGEDDWTEWSDPVEVVNSPPYTPVVVTESTTKPSLDNISTVTLKYEGGPYKTLKWEFHNGSPYAPVEEWKDGGNSPTRVYQGASSNNSVWRLTVTQLNGCISEYSDTIRTTASMPDDVIARPSSFTAMPASENRMNLFWEDNSNNERGFEIYRTTVPQGAGQPTRSSYFKFVTKTTADEEFFVDRGLEANTTYYYQLRAVNWDGSSQYTGTSGKTFEDDEAPSRPGNLTAYGNFDSESITLNWNASTDNQAVVGYNVYEIVDGILENPPVGTTTSETTFTVTGLVENTTHTYVVKAVDAAGNESEQSNQATAITQPCGLAYKLYSQSGVNSVDQLLESNVVASGRTNNFAISVRADHPKDNGATYEDYFGFEFTGFIVIKEQGNYTFQTSSDDGSKLWITNNGVETLVVNNDGRHGTQMKDGNITLAVGTYPIRVRYFENEFGNVLDVKYRLTSSGGSSSSSAIPDEYLCGGNAVMLAAPFNLTALPQSESSIMLNWEDNNSDEYGFEIYKSTYEGDGYELIHTTSGSGLSYVDGDLNGNTTYYYKVRAIGPTGESAYSNTVSAVTNEDGVPPSPVIDLTEVNHSNHTALLSWSPSTDNIAVTGYNVYLRVDGEDNLLAVVDEEGDAVATSQKEGEMGLLSEAAVSPKRYFLLRGLMSGTTYIIVVKAFDTAGNESIGNIPTEVNTSGPTPQPIELVSFTAKVENKAVELNWKTASETNNDFFTLERADNSKDFKVIGTVTGAGNSLTELAYSFTDQYPVSGTMYYRLKQTDYNGDFEYFDIIPVQYSFAGSLVLFPNPTSSENINIRLEGNDNFGTGYIKILDMVGNTYFESSFETDTLHKGVKINVDKVLTPGLYFAIIEHANKISKLKLIIK